MQRTIIYAPNVRSGGGAVLLRSLFNAAKNKTHYLFILNDEFKTATISNVAASFPPGALGRLLAEKFLKNFAKPDDLVLLFHGAPSLYNIKASQYLFIQNTLLLSDESLRDYKLSTKIRILFERKLLGLRLESIKQIYVQTDSMKKLADSFLRSRKVLNCPSIQVTPFMSNFSARQQATPRSADYFYPAFSQPHKNHLILFKAWKLLVDSGLNRKLLVTLEDDFFSEVLVSSGCVNYSDFFQNLGVLSHEEILAQYASVKALIFPSKTESFGLPLVEAENANLPIIAAELDYVRDVVSPNQTFDPNSEISIFRAILRFEGKTNTMVKCLDPNDFLMGLHHPIA